MVSKKDKNQARLSRKARVRAKISGTAERPRLNVYRSLNHIYAQLIDDVSQTTITSSSTMEKTVAAQLKDLTKTQQAEIVGKTIAQKALEKGITEVVFDRAGYLYTGRVAAVAQGARDAGLKL